MFKLRSFSQLCQHAAVKRSLCSPEINIWKFNVLSTLRSEKFIGHFLPCSYIYFPYIYWYVVIMSTIGMFYTMYEFVAVFHGNASPTTFRTRHYRVLPLAIRRNARLIGSVTMCSFYIFLVLGVLMMVPELIIPWLSVQGIILLLDFSFWVVDLLLGEEALTLANVISYIMVIYSWMFVWCIKHTFQFAIQNGVSLDKFALL